MQEQKCGERTHTSSRAKKMARVDFLADGARFLFGMFQTYRRYCSRRSKVAMPTPEQGSPLSLSGKDFDVRAG